MILFLVLTCLAGASAITYVYDAAGRLTKVDYGNGTAIQYTYDKAGNLLKRFVGSPCDVKQTGSTNVSDVQAVINEALGAAAATDDLNQDGVTNVVDVQILVSAVLGLGCSAK